MDALTDRLIAALDALAGVDGKHPTVLDGVKVMRADTYRPLGPVLYEPSIVVIAQGRKQGRLGNQLYVYDANNYLVLSVPLPFDCETFPAEHGPLLGLALRIDPQMLSELLLQVDAEAVDGEPRGMYSTPLEPALLDAAVRLAECLLVPTEARVLGWGLRREVLYRVLCGPQGKRLRHALGGNPQGSELARVLRRLHSDCARPFRVDECAAELGMSVSSFHAAFKHLTASSPLQYVKSLRLHRARGLMVEEGLNVAAAAEQVGYDSASQFSREFKRLFGVAPGRNASAARAALAAAPR